MRVLFAFLGLSLVCASCIPERRSGVVYPDPSLALPQRIEPVSQGSLWREGKEAFLFTDNKARWPGDLVTVKVVETHSAVNQAKTETSRDSVVEAKVNNLLGAPLHFGLDRIWPGGFRPEVGASTKTDFQGEGTTSRSTQIIATITCRVVQVLPNGNLLIEGHREVKLNREREYITLRGIVRPEDIGPDNSVLSTAISDAVIEYSGRGVVSEKQGPGFLTRILDLIWPF